MVVVDLKIKMKKKIDLYFAERSLWGPKLKVKVEWGLKKIDDQI